MKWQSNSLWLCLFLMCSTMSIVTTTLSPPSSSSMSMGLLCDANVSASSSSADVPIHISWTFFAQEFVRIGLVFPTSYVSGTRSVLITLDNAIVLHLSDFEHDQHHHVEEGQSHMCITFWELNNKNSSSSHRRIPHNIWGKNISKFTPQADGMTKWSVAFSFSFAKLGLKNVVESSVSVDVVQPRADEDCPPRQLSHTPRGARIPWDWELNYHHRGQCCTPSKCGQQSDPFKERARAVRNAISHRYTSTCPMDPSQVKYYRAFTPTQECRTHPEYNLKYVHPNRLCLDGVYQRDPSCFHSHHQDLTNCSSLTDCAAQEYKCHKVTLLALKKSLQKDCGPSVQEWLDKVKCTDHFACEVLGCQQREYTYACLGVQYKHYTDDDDDSGDGNDGGEDGTTSASSISFFHSLSETTKVIVLGSSVVTVVSLVYVIYVLRDVKFNQQKNSQRRLRKQE